MDIRALNPDELGLLLDLYQHLHDRDDPLPGPERVQAIWNAICADENHHIFGVFEQEQLVAACVLNIILNLTRGCRPYGLIENVITHPDFRRRHMGRALLDHGLSFAWARGCYKVMLLTGRKDEGVFQFYESAGFDRNAKQAFLAKP